MTRFGLGWRLVTVCTLLAAFCVLPDGVARAGTAAVAEHVFYDEQPHGERVANHYEVMTYAASPGEVNDVTTTLADQAIVFADSGAPVTAGAGCTQTTQHEVRCAAKQTDFQAVVRAGDGNDIVRGGNAGVYGGPGDDTVTGDNYGGWLHGGPGDDKLTAGDYSTTLRGGTGNDTLVGGAGFDELRGGGGSDRLDGGGGPDTLIGDGAGERPSPDSIDGGPGEDTVSYANREAGVRIDLERVDGNGEPGENDQITGIENAYGSAGSDRIFGSAERNVLYGDGSLEILQPDAIQDNRHQHDLLVGRGGDDSLTGSAGPDRLVGGSGADGLDGNGGADRYHAGPGDDVIHMADGGTGSEAHCGGGAGDFVQFAHAHDVVPPDCESVELDDVVVSSTLTRIGESSLSLQVKQEDDSNTIQGCRANFALFGPFGPSVHRAPLVGRGEVRLRPRRTRTLKIQLTPYGRGLLANGRRVGIHVRARGRHKCRVDGPEDSSPFGDVTLLLVQGSADRPSARTRTSRSQAMESGSRYSALGVVAWR